MDLAVYAIEAETEARHWWFSGRRRLFAAELRRAGIPLNARILDVGTGTGSNLRMLRDRGFSRVAGLDASDEAIRYCASKGLGKVRKGDICAMPFADETFDFVLATDVIEHVDDDRQAVAEIARVLVPGGKALVTVPAFQSLWGMQDRLANHKRRYRRRPLLRLLYEGGLEAERSYHFNYLLFGPIWAARRLIDLFHIDLKSEGQLNTPLLNRLCAAMFTVDVSTAGLVRVPFGVSIIAILRKKG